MDKEVNNASTECIIRFLRESFSTKDVELRNGTIEKKQVVRDRIVCEDGFSMSIQAGKDWFCHPRETRPDGMYEALEVGFPSAKELLLMPYAYEPKKPCKTVYSYVPVQIVANIVRKHGGFREQKP